ncbi:DNA translocase FtsK [Halomonas sp. AOP27-A1-41]|uniref:DNA translocase FtsK n=1 Tax=Halomonas sp. AOP27-A1-41 TaxID=3457707 RepID=UPI004033E050
MPPRRYALTNQHDDPLYSDAVDFVQQEKKASVSGIQRKFKLGYNRAAQLIEEMERFGVVSAMNNSGQRKVLP